MICGECVRVVYSRDMREKNPIWCVGRLKYNVCFEKCKAVKQYTTKCQERLQNDDQRNRNPSSQFMLGEYDFPNSFHLKDILLHLLCCCSRHWWSANVASVKSGSARTPIRCTRNAIAWRTLAFTRTVLTRPFS
jgi:hypothetical protein